MSKLFERALRVLTLLAFVATSFLNVLSAYAAPGDCDGTPADDPPITCSADPANPDVGLGLGDDTYVQEGGVTTGSVGGDADEDGLLGSGDGGDDHITINGTVNSCVSGDFVTGNGGNDTIIINGDVGCQVTGDSAGGAGGDDVITVGVNGEVAALIGDDTPGKGGNDTITVDGKVDSVVIGDFAGNGGGDDTIVINGEAEGVIGDYAFVGSGGNDTIVINGDVEFLVYGDFADGNGGNDTIVINGTVGGDVYGDSVTGDGGNDTIIINGTVGGNVYADSDSGGSADGDDTVQLGLQARVGGTIDGEDGFDTLAFKFLLQSEADQLDPASGMLNYNGRTFTWLNFERLLGLLQEAAAAHMRTWVLGGGLVGIESLDGIKVFRGDTLVAFISYASLGKLDPEDGPRRYQAVHSNNWYTLVDNLGPARSGAEVFQVSIYSPLSQLAGQFTFTN